jgi:hypothetical protein
MDHNIEYVRFYIFTQKFHRCKIILFNLKLKKTENCDDTRTQAVQRF